MPEATHSIQAIGLRDQHTLVATYERLWQLRHPHGRGGLNLLVIAAGPSHENDWLRTCSEVVARGGCGHAERFMPAANSRSIAIRELVQSIAHQVVAYPG